MSMGEIFGEPISVYTRAQAIEDGVLVDVTMTAGLVGFTMHTAMTATLAFSRGHDPVEAVAWIRSVLEAARVAVASAPPRTDRATFTVDGIEAWIHCGPGDTAAPVLTLMLEGED